MHYLVTFSQWICRVCALCCPKKRQWASYKVETTQKLPRWFLWHFKEWVSWKLLSALESSFRPSYLEVCIGKRRKACLKLEINLPKTRSDRTSWSFCWSDNTEVTSPNGLLRTGTVLTCIILNSLSTWKPRSHDLLHLSLGVVLSDTALFTDYTPEFLKAPVSRLLYEYLKDRRHQHKLLFQEFTTLCSALMSERNAPILRTFKEELMETPLPNWLEFIEKASSTVPLSDKGSSQDAINEFIQAYGPVDMPFC